MAEMVQEDFFGMIWMESQMLFKTQLRGKDEKDI